MSIEVVRANGAEPSSVRGERETAARSGRAVQVAPRAEVYERLIAPFDTTFSDVRGGVEFTYITGEQAVSRLNEVLGVTGWSFRVLEHGIHAEADEVWVLGDLTASLDGCSVARQQFGSQKIRRSRSGGTPMDIGFDLKGAATDALKKCASQLGVGLYLSRREAVEVSGHGGANGHHHGSGHTQATAEAEPISCEVCSEELRETRFRDGTGWSPQQLADFGRRKHGRVLCMAHYREANDARRRAEAPVEETPF